MVSGDESDSRVGRGQREEEWGSKTMKGNIFGRWHARITVLVVDETGMSTVEYAAIDDCTHTPVDGHVHRRGISQAVSVDN